MRTFFIAAAPRSATGFLSALLTTDTTLCLHEGLKFVSHIENYPWFFESTGKLVCGDAGAHIPFIWPKLKDLYPESSFLVIERGVQAVIRSAGVVGIPKEATLQSLEALSGCPGLRVKFEDVFSLEGAREIWYHCLGPLPFDEVRYQVLRRLNIQATKDTHEETKKFVNNGVATDFYKG